MGRGTDARGEPAAPDGGVLRRLARRYTPAVARPKTDESPLELELRRERAQALSRAGERLEAALRGLARVEAALQTAPGEATPAARAARDEALAAAGERLWFLVVQREAVGLRDHRVLDDVYRVPAEVHAAMGPRRRSG